MSQFTHLLQPQSEEYALALSAEAYCSAEFLRLEEEALFEQQWQLVGHLSQVPNQSDQLSCQIGRIPILVVHTETGELKALHNVCRHRAGPLAVANKKVLRCRYHGWTYDLTGQLKSAPEMQSTPNFNVCEHRLPEALLEIWQGLIFVAIKQPAQSVSSALSAIPKQILPIDIAAMQFSHRDEYLIDCNWKVYIDNYLEGYHLPHVHPGLSKLLDYRNYQTKLYEHYSYQFSPLDNAEKNSADIFYGEGSAHYYCIFPNLMLNILPGRLQTNIILPEGHDKTRIYFDYYYSDLHSDKTQKLIEQDKSFSDEVQQEDITICEQVQTGLNSGSYVSGPLCIKRESGLLHFQNLLRKTIQQNIKK